MARGSRRRGGRYHWEVYRIEELLPPASAGREVLLLGCGDGGEKEELGRLGFRSWGLDIKRAPGTDLVGDAHALPFRRGNFDVVLSMQVLEHLHSPWIAVEEVARVLKPGGFFIGSVAFLKPYHASYFHMTHDGVRALFARAGLAMDHASGAQSLAYTFLGSLLPFGSRPLRRGVLGWIDRLALGARAAAWSVTRKTSPKRPTKRFDEALELSFSTFDKLRYAPAVVFRGRKEEEAE